jgi:hypothetical protein
MKVHCQTHGCCREAVDHNFPKPNAAKCCVVLSLLAEACISRAPNQKYNTPRASISVPVIRSVIASSLGAAYQMEAATSIKDMPDSLPALSDIVVIPEPPGSTVVNPHDIPLNPFCTQPSQEEFASRYPPSAPQVDLLRASQPLNPLNADDGRDYMQDDHNQLAEYNAQQAQDKEDARRHHSLLKVEHQNSKANRRGPMDEMRQLVRILVKLIPTSLPHLKMDEAGGGNRVSEEEIKNYMEKVLGEQAPQPKWGLPDGWGSYLAGTDRQLPHPPRTNTISDCNQPCRRTVFLGCRPASVAGRCHEVCKAPAWAQLGSCRG